MRALKLVVVLLAAAVLMLIAGMAPIARQRARSTAARPRSGGGDTTVSTVAALRDHVLRDARAKYPNRLFQYLPLLAPNDTRIRSPGDEAANVSSGVCASCYVTLSAHPRVLHFPNLLTREEAAHLIAVGEPLLKRSGVVSKRSIDNARTSFGARLPSGDAMIARVDERLLFVVNNFVADRARRQFKAGGAERLDLLRYEGAQKYSGHVDYFSGLDGPILRAKRRKNENATMMDRGVTIILFLNDMDPAAPGGHTTFPFSSDVGFDAATYNATKEEHSVRSLKRLMRQRTRFRTNKDDPCVPLRDADDEGEPLGDMVRVKPRAGSAVLFYSLYENGVADPFSLHAGCPPIRREELAALGIRDDDEEAARRFRKFVATKWFMLPLRG